MIRDPFLLLLCGLPFAGKTTLATALVAQRGCHYVSLDAVNRERGVGNDGQAIPPREWELSYAEAYRRVAEHLQRGQSVIYDETNFLRAQRDKLRSIAASCGVSTYVLYVTTPESEVRRRWQQNRVEPQRGDVRDDDFALVVAQFEPPTDDELLIRYDTSLAIEPWIKATFD